MIDGDADEPLSDAEWLSLVRLLKRFANTELDQWSAWRFTTRFGEVYLEMTRELPTVADDSAYEDLDLGRHSDSE